MESWDTSRPLSHAHSYRRRRAARSSGENAGRSTPVSPRRPISAMAMSRAHSRSPSTMGGARLGAAVGGAAKSAIEQGVLRGDGTAGVDANDVLGTGGHHHDAVDERTKDHAVAWLRDGFPPFQISARKHRNVHPQIEGRGTDRGGDAERPEGSVEIVGAARMIGGAAELCIPRRIAGRDDGVVHTGRCVRFEEQHGLAPIVDEYVADARRETAQGGAGVLHREIDAGILCVEGPEVHDLSTEGIDDLQRLSAGDLDGATLTRRNFMCGRHAHYPLLAGSRCIVPTSAAS